MTLRQMLAKRQRRKHAATWPIDEAAGRPPEGWLGWPDGKQFAFVITHDVEGRRGLERVPMLAELEMRLGFRSSFNFIPEGEYKVPSELREWLIANGFEVGVHDLKHDGKLYRSRKDFRQRAQRINAHAKAWGAVGYRSGFMLRNLAWHHDLDVTYDASTFDTDPFEIQPDGVGTIFPFWMASPGKHCDHSLTDPTTDKGYAELPYTLPQDSTLFLVLKEQSPGIWLNKTDWIAAHGGMALLNVHPDYVAFDNEATSARTFPVEHYISLLQHIRLHHHGSVWHALPKEVAKYVAAIRPTAPRRPKRVCMVTHSFYENDNRVTRYAEALAERGDHVDVLALRRAPTMPKTELIGGVYVHRIRDRFGKNEQSKASYVWPWLSFFIGSTLWLTRSHWRRPYDILHIHNMPDFLVFAAWLPRLTRARVLLDIHDIVPEFYASKFAAGKTSLIARALRWQERAAACFAHHVIISNHLWLRTYAARTRTEGRCTVFINNVETRLFRPHARERKDGRFIIIFPGGLQWHQGLDIAIRAFQQVIVDLPKAEFHIYGEGNMKPTLVSLVEELRLTDKVKFFEPVDVKQVARIMAEADLGVVPKRADSFGNEAYSTKIMEFMSVGVPVVVSSTRIDRYYFDESVVRFFPSGNSTALAKAILALANDPDARQSLVANALAFAERNSWASRKTEYFALTDATQAQETQPTPSSVKEPLSA